ncbi:exosortase C-terminal domain/associated protein EpsI [Desulfospira joergensenii]|uniref:exosortase C-terminal domain/associated protein EpsI n=1 Tax=Desulfospira joergensenii TaxID=53329 RepID=UPI0003B6ECA8|nr:exosortase C-terminal domain/associated protein EpsI [Desulfospira joergensenii]
MTWKKTVIIVSILLATAGSTALISRSERVLPNRPFSEFPLEVDRWKGRKGALDPAVYNILGVEDYILADYRNEAGEMVNLYVGFYQSQKEGDIIHSPKNCMPGAGWNIIDTSIESVQIDHGKSVKVIRLLLEKGTEKQLVLYWFQSRGRIISSEYAQKIWLVVDSITRQRTDGSFVRLISTVKGNEKRTLNRLKDFANIIFPILNEYIPS